MAAPPTAALSGEVTTIDLHREFLVQIRRHLGDTASTLEQARAHADAQKVPQAVLDAHDQAQEAAQAAADQVQAALNTLDSALAAAEEAVKGLGRATSSEYLRGE